MHRGWTIAISLSLLLHLTVAGIVSHKRTQVPLQPIEKMQTKQPVKAVSVDSAQLNAAIQAIKTKRAQKEAAELARVQKLEQRAAAAERSKKQNENKINALKKEITQQKQDADKRLADAKQKAQAEQARLAKLKSEAAEKQALIEKAQSKAKEAQEKALAAKAAAEIARAEEAELKVAQAAEAAKLAEARVQSEVLKYTNLIRSVIAKHWLVPDAVDKGLSAQLLVQLGPGGEVLDVQILKESGDALLDRSAVKAVYKASPLPVPADELVFERFKQLRLTVRPEDITMTLA